MGPESFSTLNISLHTIVQLGFLIMTAGYIIFTLILYYHWNQYSTDEKMTSVTYTIYFVTTIPLMIALGILTLLIV